MAVVYSRIVASLIYQTLAATSGVTDAVGNRIVRGVGYPAGIALPACLFYMEQSQYDGGQLAGAEHIQGASMRWVVRLDDEGYTEERIAEAFMAQENALAGLVVDHPDGTQVTFNALGQAPVNPYPDGGDFYQQLGTIYSVDVTRG